MQTSSTAPGARSNKSRTASLPQIAQPQLPKGGGALANLNSSFQPQAFSGTGQPGWQVTEYHARNETSFARIEQWVRLEDGDIYWQVTEANNAVHVFGKDSNARLADPQAVIALKTT